MSETTAASDSPAPEPSTAPRRRLALGLWLLLVLLAALALAGWAGWRGWQSLQATLQTQQDALHQVESRLQTTRSDVDTLQAKLADASETTQHDSLRIAGLQGRVEDVERSVGALGNVVSGGRQRVQLDVVEQLLLSANDAVQLAHDPVTARRALAAADARLGQLDSPRLFALRKTLAQERAALKAVDEPDLTAAGVKLGELIDVSAKLPLSVQPHPLTPAPADDGGGSRSGDTANGSGGWLQRGTRRALHALRALFHVRRTDRPVEPMLSAQQAPLVGAVLALRLESARGALLRRDTTLYRSALTSAAEWLHAYYRVDAPAVRGALDTLRQLAALNLDPPLPDISASVEQLRALRHAAQD